MKQFKEKQKVWAYTYDLGLLEGKFVKYDKSNTCHILFKKGDIEFPKLIELVNIHESNELAFDYATVINYKRGWLRREMEKNPSINYQNQLSSSVNSFPEMWI